ncbi:MULTISPECIES: sugar ABC transporter substrate-binding protein [unclassified Rhizobium]|uniref:sugar ABC transporter substrate-binding protein n=1 Tax=unclassified Rhizobium TaxID=2613769 RepID=UPI001AD9B8F2|nr:MULTISPECIES: sugar ABC transporter substrate-binding protein [unclassified Rhizobium]MBO9127899.1 sugar ABC transporter substrate-binding protein [Rhizobium sp. 16-488-2b]MBO9178293.1 sugar ABC transporter substrate-binding protein [Rhizobium sp. 16-488-2a]
MKKLVSGLLAVAAVTLAVMPVRAADETVIGAVIYARDSQFWQQIERGMTDAAKKYNVTLQVGQNRRQLPTEAQVIEDLVTRGAKAIVMPPLDVNASAAAAKRATGRGVVIVDFDTSLADKSIAKHTIGVDSYKMAAELGTEMVKQLSGINGGKNTVGLITLPPTNPNMMPRKTGLLSTLKGDGITVGAEVAAATPELGANGYENLLQRDPKTSAVWASNSGSLAGAAQAAKRQSSNVRLYGVDMSQELATDMLDPSGKVYAVADQQPYQVGYAAVESAVKDLKGETVPRNVEVQSKIYTRENPDEVKKYLDFVKSLANN